MCRGWQTEAKGVLQRSSKLYATKKLTDCKFIFGKNSNNVSLIEAHKVLLAMASPVFEAMLYGDLYEADKPIAIEDIASTTFEKFLKYIYTDSLESKDLTNAEEACSLWNAAKKYLISDLVEVCINYLLEILTDENVWIILEHAQLFSCDLVKERCLDIISMMGGSPFNAGTFENVTKTTLLAVLGAEQLNVESEVEVFNALERWAAKECERQNLPKTFENLRSVSENGVKKIRFLTMPPEEFTRGPIASPMLSRDESLAILATIVSGLTQNYGSIIPFPVGFSTSYNTRCPRVVAPAPIPKSFCSRYFVTFEMKDVKNVIPSTITLKKYRQFSLSFTPNENVALVQFTLPVVSSSIQYTARLYNEKSQLVAHKFFSCDQSSFAFSDKIIFIPNGKKYTLRLMVNKPGSCPVLLNTVSQGTIELTNIQRPQYSIHLSDFRGEIFVTSIEFACLQ